MPSSVLYRRHDAASQTKYQELKQLAGSQRRVLAGTPGTLKQRTQSGKQYWVREHIRADGRKTDEYIGAAASTPEETIRSLGAELELAKALAAGLGYLRLLGYQRLERKPAAVLAVLFNRGLFAAGLTLVGSHAYATLLNEAGILAPGYRTQDIDLARARPLEIALSRESSFEALLGETGLAFAAVPGMPSNRPSSSFKLPGAEGLAVDLLVQGKKTGELLPVKELAAHAQTIPLLDFLVEEPIKGLALSPNQVIPLFVPSPERFLLHKLYSSQSRRSSDRDKVRKDLEQAAVLAAAVEEQTPGRTDEAFRLMPRGGRTLTKLGARAAARLLAGHVEAEAAVKRIAGR